MALSLIETPSVRTIEKHTVSNDRSGDRCVSFRTTSACFGHVRLRSERLDAQDVFCSTKPSWQGDRCAPPLHPPGRGSVRALNPCRSQQTVSPVNHSRETSLSLHPSIPSGGSGAIAPPEPTRTVWSLHPQSRVRSSSPDTPMTISWRPTLRGLNAATSWRRPRRDRGGEHSCCPSLEPSHRPRGASHPLEPRPTLRHLDVASVLPLNHNQGHFQPLETHRSGVQAGLLTTNRGQTTMCGTLTGNVCLRCHLNLWITSLNPFATTSGRAKTEP